MCSGFDRWLLDFHICCYSKPSTPSMTSFRPKQIGRTARLRRLRHITANVCFQNSRRHSDLHHKRQFDFCRSTKLVASARHSGVKPRYPSLSVETLSYFIDEGIPRSDDGQKAQKTSCYIRPGKAGHEGIVLISVGAQVWLGIVNGLVPEPPHAS